MRVISTSGRKGIFSYNSNMHHHQIVTYTRILKLWAKLTFGYGKQCTWFKDYLATYLCIEPVNPKYSNILYTKMENAYLFSAMVSN